MLKHKIHHKLKSLKKHIRKPNLADPSSWNVWILLIVSILSIYLIARSSLREKIVQFINPDPTLQRQQITKLTNQLTDLNAEIKKDPANVKQVEQMVEIASQRQQELIKQAQEDPQGFLNQANLSGDRNQFPDAVKDLLEQETKAEGDFTAVHLDDFENKLEDLESRKSKFDYFLENSDKTFNLRFAQKPPHLTTGAKVRVNGISIAQELVTQTGDSSGAQYRTEVLVPAGGGSTVSIQKTAVILVKFGSSGAPAGASASGGVPGGGGGGGGDSEPISASQVENLVFGQGKSVNNYYIDNSLGKISLSGDVFGYYTINSLNTCSYYTWANSARNAALAAGVDLSTYRRQVFVFADDRNCGYGGLGTVGGNPSTSWIFSAYFDPRIYNHELGHNFGVHHANTFECGDRVVDSYSECYNGEYGDIYDVMGNFWPVGDESYHFNGPHKASVGWIPVSNIKDISRAGTYTVSNIETSTTNPQILRVAKPDTDDYYYITYRKKTGFDSLLPDLLTRGVSIHLWNNEGWTQTKLLDTTPGNGKFSDSTLSDGALFYDQINSVTIKQLSHTEDSATIEVTTAPKFSSQVTNWKKLNVLPQALQMHASAAGNGYLYVLGGMNNSYAVQSAVYFAKVNDDGTLGAWSTTTSLPQPVFLLNAASVNGYIWALGGINDNYDTQPNIYAAKVNDDGTLGAWSNIGTLAVSDSYNNPTITVFNGYLYSIDRYASGSPVRVAKINEDGTLGAWSATTNWLDDSHEIALAGSRDRLYAISRTYDDSYNPTSIIYSTKINEDGTLNLWTKVSPSLDNAQANFALVENLGYLFVTGGWNISDFQPQRLLTLSKTSKDGTLTTWLKNSPMPQRMQAHAAVAYNGYLFMTGGYGGAYGGTIDNFETFEPGNSFTVNNVLSAVYSAKLPASILEQVPVGYLETITPDGYIQGWAFDPDEPNHEIDIEFYVDKPYSKEASPSAAFSSRTTVFRGDVNSGRYVTGNHGFKVLVPAEYKETNRQIYAYGVDTQNGTRKELLQSPRGSQDTNLIPSGVFEKITEYGYLEGWAFDPDESSKSATVEFYFDAPLESKATSSADLVAVTNVLRAAINKNRNITGNHGFLVRIPDKYWDHVSHQVFGYMVDLKTGKKNRMSNSARTFNSRSFLNEASPSANPVSAPITTAQTLGVNKDPNLLTKLVDWINSLFARF